MDIFKSIVTVLMYWALPAIIILLCDRYGWMRKTGEIVFAYVIGLVMGHVGVLPGNAMEIQEVMFILTIPLAIPLMLFNSDVHQWFRLAPRTLLALIGGLVALVITVVSGFFVFSSPPSETYAKVGGLFLGLYTGGIPNIAALQFILGVDNDVYLAVNAYDIAVGTGYLFFLLVFGRRIFGLFLPSYKKSASTLGLAVQSDVVTNEKMWGLTSVVRRKPLLLVLGLSLLIVAVSAALMFLLPENSQLAVFVLAITTLGILSSLSGKIRRTEKSFELGMYFVLVFSIVIASKVNVFSLKIMDMGLFGYMTYTVFGTLLLHSFFSWMFRVDKDTMMVCSAALVCSPPFVPVVASSIGNRHVLVPGITVGIIGYALGNYLGVLVYQLLMRFL
jgi:uncharacterized membrane protein